MGSFSSGSRCHGRESSVRFIHSYLMRSAYPKCCKSMMHKPPSSGGRQTLGQASKQCLPLADCSFPEKCSSNIVNTFDGPRREANSKSSVGIADKVLLIRTILPARFRRPAFQNGNLFATLSTNGCKAALLNRLKPSGIPR